MIPLAVFFDLDGTLFKPEHLIHNAVSIALIKNGAPEHYVPNWCIHKFIGNHPDEICDLVNQEESLKISYSDFKYEMIKAFKLIAQTKPSEMSLCDEAMDFIKALNKHQIPIGIVSNGLQDNVEIILDATGLDKYFEDDEIITPCQGFLPKPSPMMLIELSKRHNIKSFSDVLYVGNSPADMKAANNAGMVAVAYTGAAENSGFHGLSLKTAGADHVFDSFNEMTNKFSVSIDSEPNHDKDLGM